MLTEKYWFVNKDLDASTIEPEEKTSKLINEDVIVNDPDRIVVSLFLESGEMSQLVISIIPEGKYYFEYKENEKLKKNLYVQPYKGRWFLYSVKPVYLIEDGSRYVSYVELTDQKDILIKNIGEKCWGHVEYVSQNAFVYHNYRIQDKKIIIGNSNDCDIVYQSEKFKEIHVELTYQNEQWKLEGSIDSVSEIAVNWSLKKKELLKIGDVIFIRGLIIILGIEFLSINDENDRVKVRNNKLRKMGDRSEIDIFVSPTKKIEKKELFNRLPRRRKPLPLNEIKIEAPPMMLNSEKIPLMLRMGGSMVMGASSMLMGNYITILSSVLFPVLTSKYTDKQKKEYESRRIERYTQYLEDKKREIKEEQVQEEHVLNYNYPELKQILTFVESGERLWERRKTDDDFLNIRVGYGCIPLLAKYSFPDEQLALEEDPLERQMYELVNSKVYLNNVPITNSFVEDYVCGILGTKRLVVSFVKRLVMQIVISHSYDEVKLIFLINEEDLKEIEFVKYLPHCWDDQKTFRFLATTSAEALQISEKLKKELDVDISKTQMPHLEDMLQKRPYYMVFSLEKKLFDSMEVLKDVMQQNKNCGISVITAFDDLPKECSKIFQLHTNGENAVVHLKDLDKEDSIFKLDRFDERLADVSMRKLSNIYLKVLKEVYALPKMITFLEMFNVGKIEHLNCIQRWKNHNPVKSLATPVGVGTDGSLFELDLHEKFHGPHGLIAGMTGSGKSEFIITYILSMAVNYHPDEVAFLLIDYKGGGLAKAFEDKERGIHLPHLMGTITNLDGAAIQRSLVSIQSENTRRQRIFNETKAKTRESSIDIYDYQALYREGIVTEPLPHLFIIADEFAELKQQEPDFMDKLISTARIGRSLGVHLILATQKPTGIVNDQILSNTKFRVCLKVQDRGDSIEMLKRPEAAELKNTGRFYLQVGYNELFALGQSAWCGAPYFPQDTVDVQKDEEIQFIDAVGQVLLKTKPKTHRRKEPFKQIVGIVQYLSYLAEKEGIVSHSMWKEPLDSHIGIEKVYFEYNLRNNNELEIPLGVIDDPYRQRQYPLLLNVQKMKNCLIVGASGSGKTTMIQTALYTLVRDYTPEQVNFYILDFSSRNLNLFRKVPHCGTVLTDENEAETESLIATLETMVEQRKRLFSAVEVGNYDSYIKVGKLPLIILVIDNISAIDEFKKGRDILDRITNLMKNGVSYGIKVIATITNINDCSYRMQHEFGSMLALQATDRYAYSNILNIHCKYEPSQMPGRGMCVVDGEGLEFQGAMVDVSGDEQERSKILKSNLKKYEDLYSSGFKALQLERVKEDENFEEFCNTFAKERLPLGYNLEKGERVAIPFQQLNSISVYIGNRDGTAFVISKMLYAARFAGMNVHIVHKKSGSVFDNVSFLKEVDPDNKFVHYKCISEEINILNEKLISMFSERTPLRKKICSKLGIGEGLEEWSAPDAIKQWRKYLRKDTQPVLVFFESMLDFELTVSPEQVGNYKTNFTMSKGYNIYYCGCFYSDDQVLLKKEQESLKNDADFVVNERTIDHIVGEEKEEEVRIREIRQAINTLKDCFNRDKFTLLFGGQFDKQDLVGLPYEYKTISSPCKQTELNKFLMYYRDSIVRMQIPVGKMENDLEDEDDCSIV